MALIWSFWHVQEVVSIYQKLVRCSRQLITIAHFFSHTFLNFKRPYNLRVIYIYICQGLAKSESIMGSALDIYNFYSSMGAKLFYQKVIYKWSKYIFFCTRVIKLLIKWPIFPVICLVYFTSFTNWVERKKVWSKGQLFWL